MKIGLALEGGSRQTIFSAGVLDAWLDEGIYFPYISGVSAGCHAAMNFVTRQRGRFRYIIQPTKIQQGRDKAHRIFDGIQKECYALHYNAAYGDMPFDFHLFFGSGVECEFGLTCLETGRSEFFQEYMSEKRLLDIVNASSALPMLFPIAQIDGKHYADGDFSDSVPARLREGLRQGRCGLDALPWRNRDGLPQVSRDFESDVQAQVSGFLPCAHVALQALREDVCRDGKARKIWQALDFPPGKRSLRPLCDGP